jgi:tRNA/tmRNA/rRNA uracil-C5-methylase (TrmA/RlmC/RlmD family)
VAVSVERATGKQQVVLVWTEQGSDDAVRLDALVQRLVESNGSCGLLHLHSLWIHYNNAWKHSNSIFDRSGRWEQRFAEENDGRIQEVLLDCDSNNNLYVPLYFPPQVFRQANLDAFAKIVLKIREWLGKQTGGENDEMKDPRQRLGHCLELYGGVGTIGLNLVDLFDSIVSSDENPYNKSCFDASVDKITVKGKPLKVSKRKKIAYHSKSATDMVHWMKGRKVSEKADVIIVDPPRKGLDSEVLEALSSGHMNGETPPNSSPHTLIYVSCGFDAFQRDYEALVGSGRWQLDHAEGHILFPGSDAIETLAIFTTTCN